MTTVETLKQTATDVLRTALGGASSVALVNFPNHGNPGDPAIWLGTRALLQDLGVRIAYSSAHWDFDPRQLQRAAGDAPVLLNGGGNLGDLYAPQQDTRMRAIASLPDNPIIQLPQSIHFKDPRNADAVGEAFRGHGNFTLIAREHNTAEFSRANWGIEPLLSPDHALGLGKLARSSAPYRRIVWLTRLPHDPEYVDYWEPEDPTVMRVEWIQGLAAKERTWGPGARAALALNRSIRARWNPESRIAPMQHALAARTYLPLAQHWVQLGTDLLESAEVVVTDKLHGHILCALLGIPHVILDNSYGKVSGTLDAWTAGLPGVHRATDGKHAYAVAQEILEASIAS